MLGSPESLHLPKQIGLAHALPEAGFRTESKLGSTFPGGEEEKKWNPKVMIAYLRVAVWKSRLGRFTARGKTDKPVLGSYSWK